MSIKKGIKKFLNFLQKVVDGAVSRSVFYWCLKNKARRKK
nr:MAG TPA: hypothetical protein [Caudoviricetes sp.]